MMRFTSADRDIFRLAIPAMGALAAEPLVSLVDTAFVGRLGADSLAALGVVTAVFGFAHFLMFLFATGLTAWSVSAPLYATIQLVARMSGAAAAMLATVMLAEQMNADNRGWALGLYATAVSLGSGIGLLALPIARIGQESWRWLFALGLIGLLFYPWLAPRLEESGAFSSLQAGNGQLGQLFFGPSAGRFWLLVIYSFSLSAFSVVAVSFSLERMINDLGISTLRATFMTLAGGALGGLGYLWGGRRADIIGRKPILMLGLVISLAGGVAFYWLADPNLLFAAILLGSFGGAMVLAISAVQRAELFPTPIRATAVQWVYSMAVLGAVVGLWLASSAIDRWGLPTAVAFSGLWVVLAIAAQIWVPETAGSELTSNEPDR